jgi:hypothetical protein
MISVSTPTVTIETLADLLEQLGGIAPDRVRFRPAPGTATEKDVLAIHDREGRLCELADGVLVEKAVGLRESLLNQATRDSYTHAAAWYPCSAASVSMAAVTSGS